MRVIAGLKPISLNGPCRRSIGVQNARGGPTRNRCCGFLKERQCRHAIDHSVRHARGPMNTGRRAMAGLGRLARRTRPARTAAGGAPQAPRRHVRPPAEQGRSRAGCYRSWRDDPSRVREPGASRARDPGRRNLEARPRRGRLASRRGAPTPVRRAPRATSSACVRSRQCKAGANARSIFGRRRPSETARGSRMSLQTCAASAIPWGWNEPSSGQTCHSSMGGARRLTGGAGDREIAKSACDRRPAAPQAKSW